jgi:hypothetical protein
MAHLADRVAMMNARTGIVYPAVFADSIGRFCCA